MGGRARKTTKWFIEKARSIYGDKFDYSKSVYYASSQTIEIICNTHGSFWQRSTDHFLGRGCPHCNRRTTLDQFITKANKLHGGKYDYSKITTPSLFGEMILTIVCPKHGEFQQACVQHLKPRGCIRCGKDNVAVALASTQEKFLELAAAIHGDLYDYSKTVYVRTDQKVEIVCKQHGSFWQTPANHTHKTLRQGCPMCAGNIRLTTEQFIGRAKAIHGDRYDYSFVKYVDSQSKVKIQCKQHGIFEQTAHDHYTGKRCPKCTYRVSKLEVVWLDTYNISKENRTKSLTMSCGKRFEVDAYDPVTNTVYEFNGDYWHGNPARFAAEDFNERSKRTFGELHQKTLDKEALLRANGYNVISIWESDFKKQIHQAKSE